MALIRRVQYLRLKKPYYKLNLRNPKSFSEKLNYLKLNERHKLGSIVADKIEVRKYVSEHAGAKYLVPMIGSFSDANEIPIDDFPDQFVIKANHGSGWNLICTDKSQLHWPTESKRLNKWLKLNAYYLSREWQYKNIKPALLCEHMLGFNINDYKFFCFNGKPKFIQVDSERFSNHQRSIYNLNWEVEPYLIRYRAIDKQVVAPYCLVEMVEVAIKLSKPFKFCRVDLYEHEGKVYFGEITLFPGGGQEPFEEIEHDFDFGSYLDLELSESIITA